VTKRAVGESNGTLAADFLDFIESLNEQAVDFVLVGGFAMGVYGIIRATADIDFLYRSSKANVRRLCIAMEKFGAPESVINERALMTPNTVMQFGQPPHRIDLLSAIDGVTFEQVWDGAMIEMIGQQKLRVIGLPELRANKRATGRRKDLDDLRQLSARKSRKNR
jgi:hypothetical protein